MTTSSKTRVLLAPGSDGSKAILVQDTSCAADVYFSSSAPADTLGRHHEGLAGGEGPALSHGPKGKCSRVSATTDVQEQKLTDGRTRLWSGLKEPISGYAYTSPQSVLDVQLIKKNVAGTGNDRLALCLGIEGLCTNDVSRVFWCQVTRTRRGWRAFFANW
eukprot:1139837-Pelagomonas_calceolata.AAC.2